MKRRLGVAIWFLAIVLPELLGSGWASAHERPRIVIGFGTYHGPAHNGYGHHRPWDHHWKHRHFRHHHHHYRPWPFYSFSLFAPLYFDPAPPAYVPPPAAYVPPPSPPAPVRCERFAGDAVIDASGRPFYGTACLWPNGKWHIVD